MVVTLGWKVTGPLVNPRAKPSEKANLPSEPILALHFLECSHKLIKKTLKRTNQGRHPRKSMMKLPAGFNKYKSHHRDASPTICLEGLSTVTAVLAEAMALYLNPQEYLAIFLQSEMIMDRIPDREVATCMAAWAE